MQNKHQGTLMHTHFPGANHREKLNVFKENILLAQNFFFLV